MKRRKKVPARYASYANYLELLRGLQHLNSNVIALQTHANVQDAQIRTAIAVSARVAPMLARIDALLGIVGENLGESLDGTLNQEGQNPEGSQ